MNPQIPHMRIVVAVSMFVLVGFAAVSAYILGWTDDELTKGNITGTWQNFALLAVGFWLGSSSAGKAKDGEPAPVVVTNAPGDPVPTTPGTTGVPGAGALPDVPEGGV